MVWRKYDELAFGPRHYRRRLRTCISSQEKKAQGCEKNWDQTRVFSQHVTLPLLRCLVTHKHSIRRERECTLGPSNANTGSIKSQPACGALVQRRSVSRNGRYGMSSG